MSPEAGWYADPTDPSAVRWWNGTGWTAQTRSAPRELALAGAVASPSSAAAGPAVSVELPAHSGPRHAAPSGRSAARTSPTPAPAQPPVPAPAPAPAPAPEPPAVAVAPPVVVADAASDRSRPGARPPAAPATAATPVLEPVAGPDAAADRSRPGSRPPAAPVSAPSPSPGDEPLAAAASQAADRSRPGAHPAAPAAAGPVVGSPAAGARQPARPATPAPTPGWADAPATSGAGSRFGGTPNAFGTIPSAFSAGAGLDHGAGTPEPYKKRGGAKRTIVGLVVAVLVLGAGAAYGVPRFLASKASAQAAQQPDVLVHTAPKSLAGQKKVTVPGVNLANVTHGFTSAGAPWAWAQTYGTRAAFTIFVASAVPDGQRPLAMRALHSHDAAQTLLGQVRAGLVDGSNQNAVTGDPTEYASPVAGKTWCMPVTVSGVSGGYCLWTSGKELLQTVTLPGLQESTAKSTLAALTTMVRSTTKAAPASSLVPK